MEYCKLFLKISTCIIGKQSLDGSKCIYRFGKGFYLIGEWGDFSGNHWNLLVKSSAIKTQIFDKTSHFHFGFSNGN